MKATKSFSQIQQGLMILQLLNVYQKLPAEFIRRGVFHGRRLSRAKTASQRATYNSLAALKQLGLIDKRPFGYKKARNLDTVTQVYYLTPAGALFLKEQFDLLGVEEAIHWTRSTPTLSPVFATHWLRTHEALLTFEAAGSFQKLSVYDWADEAGMKQLREDGDWQWPVLPDGLIYLSDGVTKLCALLEIDRSTESPAGTAKNAFIKKIPKYIEILNGYKRDAFFDEMPMPLVCTLCETEARARSLMDATQQAGGRSNFWFGTFAMLEDPLTFFDAPWLVATETKPRTINGKLAQ